MYGRSAVYYDAIYGFKDYEKESGRLRHLIQRHKKSAGNDLLDIACGTGNHITYLKRHYVTEGLDINPAMLEQARRKHPDVVFHRADAASFRLDKRYDVITCLFSAIGHVKTIARLKKAVRNLAHHLEPGGVLIIEPWFTPKQWDVGRISANFVDQPRLKIARMAVAKRRRNLALQDLHHLIASPSGIEHFVEHLEMGLFTHQQYLEAFRAATLRTVYDPRGLIGRGLYLGIRPLK